MSLGYLSAAYRYTTHHTADRQIRQRRPPHTPEHTRFARYPDAPSLTAPLSSSRDSSLRAPSLLTACFSPSTLISLHGSCPSRWWNHHRMRLNTGLSHPPLAFFNL